MRFAEVYGLETIKQKLAASIDGDRLPHAQLYLGAEGSGKLALAHAVVQYLYCSDKSDGDSCGVCSSCRKVSTLTHPDVHYSFPFTGGNKISSSNFLEEWRTINKEGSYFSTEDWMLRIADNENKAPNITALETKQILSKLSLKPYEGDYKALIIWMPEFLGHQSNALLKLIEEPPQKTYFILVAQNSEELLATIKSRTQLVKIPLYTESETQLFLKEKYGLDESKAEQISYLAEGNLRKATDLVERVEDNYSAMFRDWMLACYTNNLQKAGTIIDALHKIGRVQLQIFLTNGLSILRESLLYSTIDSYEVKAEQDQVEFIKKFSKTLNPAHIQKSYEQINDVIYHIKRNANAKVTLFHLTLNLRYNFVRNK